MPNIHDWTSREARKFLPFFFALELSQTRFQGTVSLSTNSSQLAILAGLLPGEAQAPWISGTYQSPCKGTWCAQPS